MLLWRVTHSQMDPAIFLLTRCPQQMEATKAPAVSPDPISPKLATVLVSVPPAPIDCAIENNPPLTVEAVCIEAAAEPAATPENYILENFWHQNHKKVEGTLLE